MKYLILALFFTFPLISSGQNKSDMKLIKEFYKALYNESIAPQKVVDKYVQYADSIQYKTAVDGILNFRNNSEDFFVSLKKDITENKYTLLPYSSFGNTDKAKFNNIPEESRKGIYKVDLKNGIIPQYVWLDNGKIESFFGFQKPGSDDFYFIVFK